MKKILTLCMAAALIFTLCACGAQQNTEAECGHEAYSDLFARLEAGDYDGARSLIDAMEGHPKTETVPPAQVQPDPVQTQTVPAAQETQTQMMQEGETVELTKYNARDYFELVEDYYFGEQTRCIQYIALKEEYKNRLMHMENVRVEVSCLVSDAYGKVDLAAEAFRSEYFDITSKDRQNITVEIDSDGTGRISHISYSAKKGCFPDFLMDVEIESGSGKLLLSE